MLLFQNKTIVILFQILLIVADVANVCLSNILDYETTTGLKYNLSAMLHNKCFWLLLLIQVLHILLVQTVSAINKQNDKNVENAIEKQQIQLLSQVAKETKKGNYEKAKEVMKIFDKLGKRRNR